MPLLFQDVLIEEGRGCQNLESFRQLKIKEKTSLLAQAQKEQVSVYFKFPNSMVFRTRLLSSFARKRISCKRPTSLPASVSQRRVTLNFVLDQEMYFMATTLSVENETIHFNADNDIFHLARRKSKRFKFPINAQASLFVKRINGELSFLKTILIDISNSGCRVGFNLEIPLIKMKDSIEGSIRISNYQSINIEGSVLSHKISFKGPFKQIFGLKFSDLSPYNQARMTALIMLLQREFYLNEFKSKK